jgi:DnaA family protein
MNPDIQPSQLPLPLTFDKRFTLQNFSSKDADYLRQQLVALFDETGEPLIGLCGPAESGKTHLLNACAHYARDCSVPYHLFDASQLESAKAAGFNEFPEGSVIAVDNLDLLAGHRHWEAEFYQIINRVKQGELRFLFSLSRQPRDIGSFRMPDLKSRLMWGLLLLLKNPDQSHLEEVLTCRARMLGLELSEDVLNYLMSRYPRSLKQQMDILYRLDHAAMSRKRRLTIPLIKETLHETS